jgi:outer membrane protein assembly factor BamB
MRFSIKLFAAIALLLTLSFAISLVAIPGATAHTPSWQIPTFAYIVAAPNPVGVGQAVHVFMWLNVPFTGAALTNDYRFHNYELSITDPNNKTTTQNFDYISDPTSSQFIVLTPDKVGTYTFNFTFPGQDYDEYGHDPASAFVNDTYLASSASTTLTVQQEQLPSPITSYPLPTQYWTRPIYGENNDWWSISSNWLGQGAPGYAGVDKPGARQESYPKDAVGPLTAHIMWTKPLQSGGVVGGNNFEIQGNTYFEGSAYNQRFANPIVLNGKLYYTEPLSFAGAPNSGFSFGEGVHGPTDCVDLRTGEVIWSRTDVPPLSFGYIYDVEDPNQHGVYPAILFTTNFARAFDADTGTALFNVTGVPSGTTVLGPQGEQLRYVIANAGTAQNPDWRLGEWNSSKLWGYVYPPNIAPTLTGLVATSTGTAVDASISNPSDPNCRYDWNASISFANGMPVPPPNPFNPNPTPFTVFGAYYNNMLLCYNGSLPNVFNAVTLNPYTYFAINLNASRGNIGDVLWWNTVNPPSSNVSINVGDSDPTAGVFVEGYRETVQWVGYSMQDGHKLWGPTPSQSPWDYYGNTGVSIAQGAAAYGKLYSSGFGGILYCYDMKNGSLLWTYGNGGPGNSTNSGFYTAYGDYPTFIAAIGNGVVYLITTEHTATAPIYKGSLTRAVNATDGTEIWTLSDYTSTLAGPLTSPPSYAIADGFATFFNGYDNQIYSVGRGPSATTVEAPKASIELGRSLVISGTVIDVSAGTQQPEQKADFPNGVPAVSDESMTEWMGYVYQQKPFPSNCTGVTVSIDVMDSNNNYRNIGTTTTDASGAFSYQWTPDIPGKYTVIATFAGTNGYWPSSAETSFAVDQPPEATPPPTPPPASNTDTYVTGFGIAIIIAIAIVGVLLLRKH